LDSEKKLIVLKRYSLVMYLCSAKSSADAKLQPVMEELDLFSDHYS